MQAPPVQSPLQMYHPSSTSQQHAIHTNGRPHYPVSPTNGLADDSMQPYQQRSYPPPPQLPSMHAGMGAPLPPALASQGPGAQASPYQYGQNPYTLPPPHGSAAGPPLQQQQQQQYDRIGPVGFSGDNGKHKFQLIVEQQPQRARMCGFGDKDRRPITPPPCIRLLITDLLTDKEVDIDTIDIGFYVVQVDLWDTNAQREVNIVRASSTTPAVSISTATTTSFPPTPDRPMMSDYAQQGMVYQTPDGQMVVGPGYPNMQRGPMGGAGYPYGYPGAGYPGAPGMGYPGSAASSSNQFTRNLIGSLTVNAARLKDADDKEGIWFVLQDLSVRTEGHFRLKMNFIDLASLSGGLNRQRSEVLASAFSESFQVYSAKKFPGVIESTPLSKTFASQGIKIPIRKDVKADRDGDDDE